MYVSTEVTLEPYINVDGAVEFCSELPYRDIVQEVDAADDAAHSNKEEFPRGSPGAIHCRHHQCSACACECVP